MRIEQNSAEELKEGYDAIEPEKFLEMLRSVNLTIYDAMDYIHAEASMWCL